MGGTIQLNFFMRGGLSGEKFEGEIFRGEISVEGTLQPRGNFQDGIFWGVNAKTQLKLHVKIGKLLNFKSFPLGVLGDVIPEGIVVGPFNNAESNGHVTFQSVVFGKKRTLGGLLSNLFSHLKGYKNFWFPLGWVFSDLI